MYSNELICKILNYINENYNTKISIEELSNRFFYNRYYIMKLFKKEIGVSITDYINNLRIYHSIISINKSNNLFINIAIKHGFYSLEYFSETFKKITGVSPTIYKNFYNTRYTETDYQYEQIIKSITSLKSFIDKIQKYQTNTKPKEYKVKKLSIFN